MILLELNPQKKDNQLLCKSTQSTYWPKHKKSVPVTTRKLVQQVRCEQ